MITRATIRFTGHVQGVGFRYAALQAAKGYEVTGFVRNLPDGRVELVAEGEMNEVDGLIAALCDGMPGHVRKVDRTDESVVGEFDGFSIR